MPATLPMTTSIRFHLSLNVSDLGRSVAFYQALFGMPPVKRRDDYAKFELEDPPLVMSLEPSAAGAGGALNHLGFRMADSASLVAMQRRLGEAGISSRREEGVECCYARQTKFFVHVLVADCPLASPPVLPGPASRVQHTPLQWEPLQRLEKAGLHAIRVLKLDANPCFTQNGVELHELQLEGR